MQVPPNRQFQPNMQEHPNRQFQPNTQEHPNRQFQPNTQEHPNRQFQPNTQEQPNRQFQPNPQIQQPFGVQVQVKQYGDTAPSSRGMGCCSYILVALSVLLIIITFPFSLILCIKIVSEYERAVVFRLGRALAGKSKGPGLCFIIPCTDNWLRVDLRTVTFDVPPQEILTKDSVSATVDAVVYYRIFNPMMAVNRVANANSSTRYLAQTTLRNVLGSMELAEILTERELVSKTVLEVLDTATVLWGVKVERIEVKDVKIPPQMQRAMAAEAEAHREANANLIVARGEWKASRALRKAASFIADSPAAMQLRYLQTLNTISAENSSTIVFPLPMELLQAFGKGRAASRRHSRKDSKLRAARRSEAEAVDALRDSEVEGVKSSRDILGMLRASELFSPKVSELAVPMKVAAAPQSNDFATSQNSDLLTPPQSRAAATPASTEERNRDAP